MDNAAVLVAVLAVLLSTLTFLRGTRTDRQSASTAYVEELERRLDRTEKDCKTRIENLERKVSRFRQRVEELEAENLTLLRRVVKEDER